MFSRTYVSRMNKLVHGTYIDFSNQVVEAKIIVHKEFANFCTAVTTDSDI